MGSINENESRSASSAAGRSWAKSGRGPTPNGPGELDSGFDKIAQGEVEQLGADTKQVSINKT